MTERYPGKTALAAVFLFISWALAPYASASVSVSPVRLDLDESHTRDVIRVSNQEEGQKSYQVEVVEWSQAEGKPEVYSPTDALLAVPPLFTLASGEEQLVRIGLLGGTGDTRERSYRVFITELAPSQTDDGAASGISMRLQIGVPVFVAPKAIPYATFDLVDSQQVDGRFVLQFRNNGNMHVKVSELTYEPPGIDEPIVTPMAMYLLSGQTGYLPVPSPDGAPAGKVRLVTDTLGTLEYELAGTP